MGVSWCGFQNGDSGVRTFLKSGFLGSKCLYIKRMPDFFWLRVGFSRKSVVAELWSERDPVADEAGSRVREELQSQATGGSRWEGDRDLAALAGKEAVFTEKGVTFSEDGRGDVLAVEHELGSVCR